MMFIWLLFALFLFPTDGAAPVFSNLRDLYIGALETNKTRLIQYLTITDADGDLVHCEITNIRSASSPGQNGVACPGGRQCAVGDEFKIRKNPGLSEAAGTAVYNFYLAPGSYAYPAESPYNVFVQCEDSNGEKQQEIIHVFIRPGQEIWWDGGDPPNQLPYKPATPFDAKTTTQGTTLGTVRASNKLGVGMMYRIVQISPTSSDLPGTPASYFDLNSNTGDITALKDLYTISTNYASSYFIDIEATDTSGELSIYGRFTVPLTNRNFPPMCYDTPITQTVSESTPVGHTFFNLNPWNPEPDQTVTATWSCTPASGNSIFNLDAGNNFVLASTLSVSSYSCTFLLNDGYHDAPWPCQFQLTVADDNDAPVFAHAMYYATFSEGAAFSMTVNPQIVCTDTEGAVTFALENSGNSSRFRIDANTGQLTLAGYYDLENGNPLTDTITVLCIDSGDPAGLNKLTATAYITVAINDVNDHAPELPARGYTWFSDNTMNPGTTIIGELFPTDTDTWAINRRIQCLWTSASTASLAAYYSGTSECELFLARTLDLDPGTPVRFVVIVKDLGNPSLSSTVTVDVINRDLTTTTTTTISTTELAYNFWDHTGSRTVFALTVLGIIGLLATGLFVLLRGWLYGWNNLWPRCTFCRYKKYPMRPVTPVTPPRTPSPREKSMVIHERVPQKVIVERPPQMMLLKRTRLVPRPVMAPFAPVLGPQMIRETPPSLLAR